MISAFPKVAVRYFFRGRRFTWVSPYLDSCPRDVGGWGEVISAQLAKVNQAGWGYQNQIDVLSLSRRDRLISEEGSEVVPGRSSLRAADAGSAVNFVAAVAGADAHPGVPDADFAGSVAVVGPERSFPAERVYAMPR